MPSLFIGGTADPGAELHAPDRAAEVVTGRYREVLIDGAGHWLQQERPDEVNATAARLPVELKTGAAVMNRPLNFGVFITPFHPIGQSPTVALEYDMERVVALDRLGFDEAWFGEHHSGGYELIACPEVFIAAAAERTKHIRLGTGVVSLPYHHPLMVADRWVLLDHLTRGRVMFGTGPGALPSDAYMMGIDPIEQRRMMQESLEAILALFRAGPSERIGRHTDWFTLRDAQLHIRPYTWPYPEISTAAMISPSGPRLAGALGTSLLSLSMSVPGGYAALDNTWQVVRGAGRQSRPGRAGPRRLASPVDHAHRRQPRAGDRRLHLRPAGFRQLLRRRRVRPAGQRGRGSADAARVRRRLCGQRQLLHRHPRRRDRAHRRPAGAVRRLRHAADARSRLGLARGDLSLL